MDSFPESGGSEQELLNEQFVRNCDAAVAVFWTRFGSPTEKYGSGTEEMPDPVAGFMQANTIYASEKLFELPVMFIKREETNC